MKVKCSLFYENINNYNFEIDSKNIVDEFNESIKVLPNDFQCDKLELRSEKTLYVKKGNLDTIKDIVNFRGKQMVFV